MGASTLKDTRLPWCSVKRSLPKQGARVIVKLDCGGVRDAYHDPDWYGGFSAGKKCGSCITGVTHWMPYR